MSIYCINNKTFYTESNITTESIDESETSVDLEENEINEVIDNDNDPDVHTDNEYASSSDDDIDHEVEHSTCKVHCR